MAITERMQQPEVVQVRLEERRDEQGKGRENECGVVSVGVWLKWCGVQRSARWHRCWTSGQHRQHRHIPVIRSSDQPSLPSPWSRWAWLGLVPSSLSLRQHHMAYITTTTTTTTFSTPPTPALLSYPSPTPVPLPCVHYAFHALAFVGLPSPSRSALGGELKAVPTIDSLIPAPAFQLIHIQLPYPPKRKENNIKTKKKPSKQADNCIGSQVGESLFPEKWITKLNCLWIPPTLLGFLQDWYPNPLVDHHFHCNQRKPWNFSHQSMCYTELSISVSFSGRKSTPSSNPNNITFTKSYYIQ